MGRNKKLQQKEQKREMQENRGCKINFTGCDQNLLCFIFLLFYALSSWSLIYDVEFDSNSSCLDRLNNFGMISSQKLQNLSQNAIIRIVGTLMCKSG